MLAPLLLASFNLSIPTPSGCISLPDYRFTGRGELQKSELTNPNVRCSETETFAS